MSSRKAFSSAALWPKGIVEIPSKRRKRFESNGDNASLFCFTVTLVGVIFRNYIIVVHSHCFSSE